MMNQAGRQPPTELRPKKMSEDFLCRFIFEDMPVKGSLVRLSSSWQEILARARPNLSALSALGEAVCASALLTSNIKFRGSVSLQIQSGGAIRLLMGQCTHEGKLRGIARMHAEKVAPLFEQAVLAINLEQASGGAPYQGIVDIGAGGFVTALERYFSQSEQLETRFWLAAGADQCGGLMLQKLPEQLPDPDDWNRLAHLASTISDTELRGLSPERLIRVLFHQENVRLFAASAIGFGCSCSPQKVAGMLHWLGYDDLMELIEERGSVEVFCEFCGQEYQFDQVDVGRIFAANPMHLPDIPGVH